MDQLAFAESIRRRFRAPAVNTVFSHIASAEPIAMSRIVSPPTWTQRCPPEDAFTIHIQTGPATRGELYVDGHPMGLVHQRQGFVRVMDMGGSPYAHIQAPIDFLRINIPRRTFEDLARDRGERRIVTLRQVINTEDPVLYSLGCALVASLDTYGPDDRLFFDYVALAIHAHLLGAYGNARSAASWRGALAPWQLRRACDMMAANLAGNVGIAELAKACGLSTSYFAHAFRNAMGKPPHRWLMDERVKHAKALLGNGTLTLADIAFACGFSDQSHMTRVFTRAEGQSPGQWRRRHRH